ncbi:MAG: hypothetical protein PVI20_09835 [Desulfobacteraceae bacterium]|jgi:hypothetical protein
MWLLRLFGFESEFQRGIIAGFCLLAAVLVQLVAVQYPEIENGKWVITGICGFVFLALTFIQSWIEARKELNA